MESNELEALIRKVFREEVEENRNPIKAVNFGEYCDRFLEEYAKPRNKTWKDDETRIRLHIKPFFGHLQLLEVTHEEIKRRHAAMKETSGLYQANRTKELLNVIFREARANGYFPKNEVLPTSGIKKFKESPRETFIEETDFPRVAASIEQTRSKRMQYMFWLYLLTGLRLSELRYAEWSWLKMSRRELWIPADKAKNLTAHHAALSPAAMAFISRMPRNSRYIFPGEQPGKPLSRTSVYKCWVRVRVRAGIDEVTLHGLRHTFASWLVESGYSLPLIGKLLNHKTIQSTIRYVHLTNKEQHAAVALLADRMTKYKH